MTVYVYQGKPGNKLRKALSAETEKQMAIVQEAAASALQEDKEVTLGKDANGAPCNSKHVPIKSGKETAEEIQHQFKAALGAHVWTHA